MDQTRRMDFFATEWTNLCPVGRQMDQSARRMDQTFCRMDHNFAEWTNIIQNDHRRMDQT